MIQKFASTTKEGVKMIRIIEIRKEGEFQCNYPTLAAAISDFERITQDNIDYLYVLQVKDENGDIIKEFRASAGAIAA